MLSDAPCWQNLSYLDPVHHSGFYGVILNHEETVDSEMWQGFTWNYYVVWSTLEIRCRCVGLCDRLVDLVLRSLLLLLACLCDGHIWVTYGG